MRKCAARRCGRSIHYAVVVTGKKFGVSELGTDVISYISHATQQRLQNILEKVSQVAQQRNVTFKVTADCGSTTVCWDS